jgi:hypothetical protein
MMDFELIGYKELLSMGNNQYYGYKDGKYYHLGGSTSTDNVHIAPVTKNDVIEEYRYKEQKKELTRWEKRNCEILWRDF